MLKEELWDSGDEKREGRSVREGIEASICSPEPCQVSSSLGCGLVVGSVRILHDVRACPECLATEMGASSREGDGQEKKGKGRRQRKREREKERKTEEKIGIRNRERQIGREQEKERTKGECGDSFVTGDGDIFFVRRVQCQERL